jgi:uncharacterized protein (DUF2141 family)
MNALLSARHAVALAVTALSLPSSVLAADVLVNVSGIAEPVGQVGCSLFSKPSGFPIDSSGAQILWLPADVKGVTCRFPDVPAGAYAVSVAHDLNRNGKLDSNLFGIPAEPWGVSNNLRPVLRAPRFEEAMFRIGAEAKEVVVDVKVAK